MADLKTFDKHLVHIDTEELRTFEKELLERLAYLNPGVPVIPKLKINYKNTVNFEKGMED